MESTGVTVAVTGAAGGLGRQIVAHLHRCGYRIVAIVRAEPDEPVLGASQTVSAELSDPDQANSVLSRIDVADGRLTGLVNVAAIQPVQPFQRITVEQWASMMSVNLDAAHWLTRSAAAIMRADGQGGSIVHISSIEGMQPAPGHAHYAVSKAGLLMHARAAALELGPDRIRVNAVSPGLCDRPGLREQWPEGVERWMAAVPLGRLTTGEDVAKACRFLLSESAEFITGANLVVDGGMSTRPTW